MASPINVENERLTADADVSAPVVLLKSAIMPISRVAIGPVGVGQGESTHGRIETARSLVIQRVKAYAGIPGAGGEARQNPNAVSFIAKGQCALNVCGLRIWHKSKAGQRQTR